METRSGKLTYRFCAFVHADAGRRPYSRRVDRRCNKRPSVSRPCSWLGTTPGSEGTKQPVSGSFRIEF